MNFFSGHSHCTRFEGVTSELADILASVNQGCAIGPAFFVVTASDLQPIHVGNVPVKFADDAYVIVPAVNSDTSTSELSHVQDWAEMNNLKLNCQKSKEIIFTARGTRNKTAIFPSQCLGICQVRSITALGVVLNDKLTAADYISSILTSCSSSLYALRVLRDHGLQNSSLHDVFRATILAKIRYCARRGRAFARLAIVLDSTHSYDAARIRATVLSIFRRRSIHVWWSTLHHGNGHTAFDQ